MHKFESHGVTFFHNSDFSGDIHMQHERGAGFAVPAAALKALALEIIKEHNESQKRAEMLLIASIAAAKLREILGVEVSGPQFLEACQAADEKAEELLGKPHGHTATPVRCDSIGVGEKRCELVTGHSGRHTCKFSV